MQYIMGVRRNFSRGGNVNILLNIHRLLTMQRKCTFTKHFSFTKCPMLQRSQKMRFLGNLARYIPIICKIGYLQILKPGYLFS